MASGGAAVGSGGLGTQAGIRGDGSSTGAGALATGASAVAAIAATQQRLVGGVEGTRVAVPRDVRFLLEAGVDSLFSQIR
jgi:hypothetical protein